jgi:hypothetical protein
MYEYTCCLIVIYIMTIVMLSWQKENRGRAVHANFVENV